MTAVEEVTAPAPAGTAVPVVWRPVPYRMPPPPLPAGASIAVRVAAALAVVAAWCALYLFALSGLQAARGQQVLYEQLRVNIAQATERIGGTIPPGTAVALIEAPSVGLRYVVVEGTAAGDLRVGPGHRRDTPLPGQAGVSLVYGRAVSFGGPFRRVTQLRTGDTITVTTGQGTFNYRVDRVRRAGDPVPDQLSTGQGRLTLVTAEGVSWRAGWVPNQVVYVDSTLLNTPVPAPSGRPSAVPHAEEALQPDPGGLVPLVLWLQLLVLATGGAAWAWLRWGSAQTWLAGLPLILLALWGASQSASQLLPNLI
ncbi:MAG: sortase [Micromonosporaceae bacterium]